MAENELEAAKATPVLASAPAAAAAPVTAAPSGLSKNQQKKLAKREWLKEKYEKKRLERKEKKQEEKAAKRQRTQQDLSGLTPEEVAAKREAAKERAKRASIERAAAKAAKLQRLAEADKHGPKLIIDLDFWDLMTPQEHRSLVSQLSFSAGSNKRSPAPCSLHLTSFDGAVAEAVKTQFPEYASWHMHKHAAGVEEAFASSKDSLTYLTADAEAELQELSPGQCYIIGGLVDRNRHKNLCHKKAQEAGIQVARLPIGNTLKMLGSKVLTVNQVVDLLLRYMETKDWRHACEAVVPDRKAAGGAKQAGSAQQGSAQQAAAGDAEQGQDAAQDPLAQACTA